jgi:hypothetical protein
MWDSRRVTVGKSGNSLAGYPLLFGVQLPRNRCWEVGTAGCGASWSQVKFDNERKITTVREIEYLLQSLLTVFLSH